MSTLSPLSQLLEAALFAANRPLTLDELGALDPDAGDADVRAALEALRDHYDFDGHAVEVVELAGGWPEPPSPRLSNGRRRPSARRASRRRRSRRWRPLPTASRWGAPKSKKSAA